MAITKGQLLSAANLNAAYVSLSSSNNDMLGNLSSSSGTFFANRVHAATDLIADLNLSVKGKAVFTKTSGVAEILGESISVGTRLKLNASEVYLNGTNVTMQSSGHLIINGSSGGNIGIGVTTPGSKLHVGGELRVSTSQTFRIIPQSDGFDISSSGNLDPHYATNFTIYKGTPGSGTHAFSLNSTMDATLYGKAIINKQTWIKGGPTGTSDTIGGTSLNNAWLRVGDALGFDPNEIYFSTLGNIGTIGNNNLQIKTNGANRMIIKGDGNVGIGTTTPGYRLDVAGTGRITGDLRVDEQVITGVGNGNGIKIGNTQITSVDGDRLTITDVDEIRFSDSSSWDYNEWAGLKYNSTNHIIYLGGPAGSVFASNDSPSTVSIDLKQGVDGVKVPNLEANTIHVLPASTYSTTYTKASVFGATDNIRRGVIRFSAASGSSDPGAIYHETSSLTADNNKGVIHICPTDDNDNVGDYVTIHGTNDPETIKLFTGGRVQTTNQFVSTIASGTAPLVVSSNTVVANLNADLLDGRQGSAYAHSNATSNNVDLNTIIQSGFHRLSTTHSNTPSHNISYGQLIVSRGGHDTISQIVMSYNSDNISFRSGNPSEVGGSGSWRSWRRLWHNGDTTITATTFSGNATSASKWATSRTITLSGDATGSVTFNGSANATLNVVVADDSHLHDSRYLKKAGDTFSGLLEIERLGKDNNGVYIPYPLGGEYETHTATVTGAMKITLPQSWTGTMMEFVIDIYNYRDNAKATYFVGGYNATTPAWANTGAYSIGYNNANSKSNLTVRFGHDGSKCCVLIGETSTAWNYPQVVVRNFFGGYNGTGLSQWESGWDISFVTTLPATINKTISNTLTKSSYSLDSDKVDGLNASSFLRSDTGNSTDVRLSSGNGRGMRFWDSDSYKIYMSSSTDSTWGGRGPGETASDHNTYFKMAGGASRGWVFKNNTTSVASIDGYGNGYFKELKSNSNRVLTTANVSTSVTSTSTTTAASSSAVKAAYDRASLALNGQFLKIDGTSTMTGGLKVNAGIGSSGINFGGTNGIYRFTDQGGLVMHCDSSMVLFAGDTPSKLTTGLGYNNATSLENVVIGADGDIMMYSKLQNGMSGSNSMIFKNNGSLEITVPSNPTISLVESANAPGAGGIISFGSTLTMQGVQIRHNYHDSERAPFGLHIERTATNDQPGNKTYLEVEGEIYANGISKVYHEGNITPFSLWTDNWFRKTSHYGYLFHMSAKSSGTFVIAPSDAVNSTVSNWSNEFNFYPSGHFDAVKLSARTQNSSFFHNGSSWINGATNAGLIFNNQSTADSYYSTLAITTYGNHKVSLGGINNQFGFTVYRAGRTANGHDGRVYINASNSTIHSEMPVSVTHGNGITSVKFTLSNSSSTIYRASDSTIMTNNTGTHFRLYDNAVTGITWAGKSVAMLTTSTASPSGTAYKGQIWIQY